MKRSNEEALSLVHPNEGKAVKYSKKSLGARSHNAGSFEDAFGVNLDTIVNPITPIVKKQSGSFFSPAVNSAIKQTPRTMHKNSPATFSSPADALKGKFGVRTNSGKVELVYNEKVVPPTKPDPRPDDMNRCEIEIVRGIRAPYKYMNTSLEQRADTLERIINEQTDALVNAHKLLDISPAGIPTQGKVTITGRICCDAEGKLNDKSVILEGSRLVSDGARTRLDLSTPDSFSLFPGQIIAVDGVDATGRKMMTKKVYSGAPFPMPTTSISTINQYNEALEDSALVIWTATGPFTTSDNLEYEPLRDFLATAKNADPQPDVIILLGPFVDSRQPILKSGDVNFSVEGERVELSFLEVFQLKVSVMLEKFFGESPRTRVVLVPSIYDAHHTPVYPQPPFYQDLSLEKNSSNLVLLSNPGTLKINEVHIGISTQDVLFHMISQDVSRFPTGTVKEPRLIRMADHLVQSRSYYPLFPPPENTCIDLKQYRNFQFPEITPDILITPTKLNYFANNVRGVLCINSGNLSKGAGAGTYSKLNITPMKNDVLYRAREAGATEVPHGIVARARVEVVRV